MVHAEAVHEAVEKAERLADQMQGQLATPAASKVSGVISRMTGTDDEVTSAEAVAAVAPEVSRIELWRKVQRENERIAKETRTFQRGAKASEDPEFRAWYMGESTKALGNELDALRRLEDFSGSDADLAQLIESLQVGLDAPVFDELSQRIPSKRVERL
mmetsp:Transcript_9968/g.18361  ORF Transcript_9968/g.18361 Transcript_9968/m.18361 type:complete len:159 (+) Transcript_9968:218-694(+)